MIMQNKNENSIIGRKDTDGRCYNQECEHHGRAHKHIRTINGTYVKFIIEKQPEGSIPHADTWRQWET